MARIFSECVILRSPETGDPVAFMPGSPVPGWAEPLVTNPAVTVGIPDEISTDTDTAGTEGNAPSGDADAGTDTGAGDADGENSGTVDTPPAAVRPYGNATKSEWADFATTLGVVIPDGATKNEIIALVDALPAAE